VLLGHRRGWSAPELQLVSRLQPHSQSPLAGSPDGGLSLFLAVAVILGDPLQGFAYVIISMFGVQLGKDLR